MGTVEVWSCMKQHLKTNMRGLVVLILVGSTLGARKLKSSKPREEKSLLNTFPFNAASEEEHYHHNEKQPSVQLEAVDASQGRRGSGTGLDGVSFGDVAGANLEGMEKD